MSPVAEPNPVRNGGSGGTRTKKNYDRTYERMELELDLTGGNGVILAGEW